MHINYLFFFFYLQEHVLSDDDDDSDENSGDEKCPERLQPLTSKTDAGKCGFLRCESWVRLN